MNEKNYKKHLTAWIVITIVLVGASFYMGGKHAQASAKSAFASRGAQGGLRAGMGGAGGNRFAGGGVIMGTVLSKDATSITIKSRDGSSKIVLYSGSTQVSKSAAGTIQDVAVGSEVSAIGTQNSDGSVTAQTIQLRPAMPPMTAPTPVAK